MRDGLQWSQSAWFESGSLSVRFACLVCGMCQGRSHRIGISAGHLALATALLGLCFPRRVFCLKWLQYLLTILSKTKARKLAFSDGKQGSFELTSPLQSFESFCFGLQTSVYLSVSPVFPRWSSPFLRQLYTCIGYDHWVHLKWQTLFLLRWSPKAGETSIKDNYSQVRCCPLDNL